MEEHPLKRVISRAIQLLGRNPMDPTVVLSAVIRRDRGEVMFADGAFVEFPIEELRSTAERADESRDGRDDTNAAAGDASIREPDRRSGGSVDMQNVENGAEKQAETTQDEIEPAVDRGHDSAVNTATNDLQGMRIVERERQQSSEVRNAAVTMPASNELVQGPGNSMTNPNVEQLIDLLLRKQADHEKELETLRAHSQLLESSLAKARIQQKGCLPPPPGLSAPSMLEQNIMDRVRREIRSEIDNQMNHLENSARNPDQNVLQDAFLEDERLEATARNSQCHSNRDEVRTRVSQTIPSHEVRRDVRSEVGLLSAIVEKDTTKLEYFLNYKKNFKMWLSMFEMELSLKRLSDVIDDEIPPPRPFTLKEMSERKKIVKGIILGHVEELYQEQIIDLAEPKEILAKLHKLKRNEINDTTVSIKEQLRNLKFNYGSETAHAFNLKFDDLVRRYDLVSDKEFSPQDKRDAYYQIVSKVIPSVKDATYRDRAKGEGEGYTFDQLKSYVQHYEAENKPLLQLRQRGAMVVQENKVRCYNCGGNNHVARECKREDGEVLCYNCNAHGHYAFECSLPPQGRRPPVRERLGTGKRPWNAEQNGPNKKFRYGSRGGGISKSRVTGVRSGRGNSFRRGFNQNSGNPNKSYGNFSNPFRTGNDKLNAGYGRSARRGRRGYKNVGNRYEANSKFNANVKTENSSYNSRTGVHSRTERSNDASTPAPQANVVLPPLLPPMMPPMPVPFPIPTPLPPFLPALPPVADFVPLGLSNPYSNVDSMKPHLVQREDQWYLNNTSYQAALFYRNKEFMEGKAREARLKENERRKGSATSSEPQSGDNPTDLATSFKERQPRRDKDEDGAGGSAMMAGGSAAGNSGGILAV